MYKCELVGETHPIPVEITNETFITIISPRYIQMETTVTFYRQLLAWSPPACSEDVNIGRRAGVLHFVVPGLIRRKLLMRF